MHEIYSQLLQHVLAISRFRWYVIITAWLVSVAGWISVHYLPDRYEATSRVYVDTQSLLRPLLAGIAVQPNTNQQVAIMANTLINRPNLEKVARVTDLALQAKTPQQMEDILNQLSTRIKLKGTGLDDNLYTISYENKDPVLAKKVVQSLLNIFVENGLGNNRKNIASSQKFIEEQLQSYQAKLLDAENAIKDFQRKNIGVMPGEMGQDYYTEIGTLQEEINQSQMSLREAENRADSLKHQLSGDDPTLLADSPASVSNPEIDARIQLLEKNLDVLRLKYTDSYPDVVAAKRLIEELKAKKAKEAAKMRPASGLSQNTFYQQMNLSLAEAEADAASMKARLQGYQARYAQLKAQADRIPEVEAEYKQLTRNYEVYKKNYDSLLSRRESAKMSGEMEAKTDVVDFRVIDPPRVPLTPSSPNRPMLNSLVLLGGIAVGIVLAFLRSQIRRTVDTRNDVFSLTDMPLLGTITLIESDHAKASKRKGWIAFSAASLSLLVVYGAVIAIHFVMSKPA